VDYENHQWSSYVNKDECFFSNHENKTEFIFSTGDLSRNTFDSKNEISRKMLKFDPCNLSNLGVEDEKSVSNVSERCKNSACEFKFNDSTINSTPEIDNCKNNFTCNLKPNHQESSEKLQNFEHTIENKIDTMLEDILTKEEKPLREYKIDLCLRKDVVNKNLLRIVSRYFKELLSQRFPNFKNSFRNPRDLDFLLTQFSEEIMGKEWDSNLKYILGAFVIAPKMKQLSLPAAIEKDVFSVHKTLSKYTHKDLDKLFSIKSVGTVFSYFLHVGSAYFLQSEVVEKNREVYLKALTYFSNKFKLPFEVNYLSS
jgi:hypothetical protein